jgi:hypothetical protein
MDIDKARGDNCTICGQCLLGLCGDGPIGANLGNFAIADTNVPSKFFGTGAINHPATAYN